MGIHKEISSSSELYLDLPSSELFSSPLMDVIIVEIYNGWPGPTGLERVNNVIDFLSKTVPSYAEVMGKSLTDTLAIFVASKNVNYVNYFQEANFPDLSTVNIFDTIDDFYLKFPSRKYICPKCDGVSDNPTEHSTKNCNWKAYGLFGTMGKGIKILIKDKMDAIPMPTAIFSPIELKGKTA